MRICMLILGLQGLTKEMQLVFCQDFNLIYLPLDQNNQYTKDAILQIFMSFFNLCQDDGY